MPQTQTLNEINTRLSAAGLPVNLDGNGAAKLKTVAPRERVLAALSRIESHGDQGARAYLEKTFQEAGLMGDAANDLPPDTISAAHMAPAPQPQQPVGAPPQAQPPAPPRQQTQSAPQTRQAAPQGEKREYIQHHVYGSKGGLCFDLDSTVAGHPTVSLDGARTTAPRQYDWPNKVRVQFTAQELPMVAAVLFGVVGSCKFSAHGPNNDKGFSIEWQGQRGSFFVKVWQGKNGTGVPMGREDAYYVGQIVLRALQQASPARLDVTGTLASLRAMYARQ